MNLRHSKNRFTDRAFTLIELLTVIAIIGIITAMIVNLAPAVNQRKKRDRVRVEKENLVSVIENYKAKFGHYPPDNANLLSAPQPLGDKLYDIYTQVNPLYYELGGGSNNVDQNGAPGGNQFMSFDGSNFSQAEITKAFGIQGILNADQEMQTVYRAPSSGHLNYPSWMAGGNKDVSGLTVPVDTIQVNSPNTNTATSANFWHYDASTTNRHNQSSYDLWAVYATGRTKDGWQFVTNNNWGQ